MYMYMYMYMYCMYMYMYVYIYIYICTCIYIFLYPSTHATSDIQPSLCLHLSPASRPAWPGATCVSFSQHVFVITCSSDVYRGLGTQQPRRTVLTPDFNLIGSSQHYTYIYIIRMYAHRSHVLHDARHMHEIVYIKHMYIYIYIYIYSQSLSRA